MHSVRKPHMALARALMVLGMFLFIPAVLLASFEWAVLDEGYHMRLYDRFRSAELGGITQSELQATGNMLVRYLKGERDDLSLTVRVGETSEPVFNEREIVHMMDVRALFDLERKLCAIFFCSGVSLLVCGTMLTKQNRSREIQTAGLISQMAWIVMLGLGVVYIISDFTRAFTLFHELLFKNDLWLLDPATDRMIRMMPEAFFAALAQRGALFMAAGMVGMFMFYSVPHWVYKWRMKKI